MTDDGNASANPSTSASCICKSSSYTYNGLSNGLIVLGEFRRRKWCYSGGARMINELSTNNDVMCRWVVVIVRRVLGVVW